MSSYKLASRAFWSFEIGLLAATVAASILFGRASEWTPVSVTVIVLTLALLGQWFSVETSSGILSASLVAIVLAMGLLGPVPAAVCGVAPIVLHSAVRRLGFSEWLNNLSAFASVPFAGALAVRWLAGGTGVRALHSDALYGVILLGVFVCALFANFLLIALDTKIEQGRSLRREFRELFLPLLPGQLAAGMLATILALGYLSAGLSMLVAALAVLLILRYLTVALLRSEARAEALEARSRQLVGLQLGVLRTLVRALSTRESSTGRHAAAVARYARALAREVGCGDEDLDVVHSAGLLHEIGKFTWPDRVLNAEVIADEDLHLVQRHPQEGAVLVGALDGYGPVAEAILYHHERVDGRGYPAGLIAQEIPLASRILAVCCTYETMVGGGGYRTPMPMAEAIEELRNAARNGQLDADLVESFVVVLDREASELAGDADFEKELDFERRVREMAEPRTGAAHDGEVEAQDRDLRSTLRGIGEGIRDRVLERS